VGYWRFFLCSASTLLGLRQDASVRLSARSLRPRLVSSPPQQEKAGPVKQNVPQRILDSILNEAAALAKIRREQLVVERAQSVVWNDGSLGCPEPGMMYTQALIKGYWVVVEAAGRKFDFRVGNGGRFRLCPPGQGHPPSEQAAESK